MIMKSEILNREQLGGWSILAVHCAESHDALSVSNG
jgi:hypothetical protein